MKTRFVFVHEFQKIVGQEVAKRALEISIIGQHSILLVGPSGMGKTALKLCADEMVTQLYEEPMLFIYESWPCPCSHYGDSLKECVCTADEIRIFEAKFPVTEMVVPVPRVGYDKLKLSCEGETNSQIFERIEKALKFEEKNTLSLKIPDDAQKLYKRAVDSLGFSAREYFTNIQLARTIATLDFSEDIKTQHVAEAIQYRMRKSTL